jgi:hypothetical protein
MRMTEAHIRKIIRQEIMEGFFDPKPGTYKDKHEQEEVRGGLTVATGALGVMTALEAIKAYAQTHRGEFQAISDKLMKLSHALDSGDMQAIQEFASNLMQENKRRK